VYARIGANIIALTGIAVLATANNLLVLAPAFQPPEKAAGAIAWIEASIGIGLAVSAVIVTIELVRDVRRLRQWKQGRPVAAAASTRPGSPR
jgi:hypothetical protein